MAHTPYGYLMKGGVVVTDALKAQQVKALFQEYVAGASLQKIAEDTEIPRSHTSLGLMIKDKRYVGDSFYPGILDRDIWREAQMERKRREKHLGRNMNYFAADKTKISPFWGILFCADCGSVFRRYKDKGHEHWKCSRYLVKGKINCRSATLLEDSLEAAFMSMIGKLDLVEIALKPKIEPAVIKKQFLDPFEQAEYLHSIAKVDDFDYMTDKLLTALIDKPESFDGDFMRRIVKRIKVEADNTVTFELINHKLIREELYTNG